MLRLARLVCSLCMLVWHAHARDDFDLVVIGGGSGGIACAKEAARLGAKVALCDYVNPSARGTKWGLGGTCVNVGCIPKKLMHRAGQLEHVVGHEAPAYGWKLGNMLEDDVEEDAADESGGESTDASDSAEKRPTLEHDWHALVERVQSYIKSLNFGYRSALQKAGIQYLNRFASFKSANVISLRDRKGAEREIRAKHVVIAVGGRPNFPDSFRGARELCVSSDDIFSLRRAPKKTLVVGGSYVALECAGFLRGLGFDVTLLMRSIPLRGFDRECADAVLNAIASEGTRVMQHCLPVSAERSENGKVRVAWRRLQRAGDGESGAETVAANEADEEEEGEDEFDTVLVAAGRLPETAALNLQAAGVAVRSDGKVKCTQAATTAHNVFCIGDCAGESPNSPELTPVAIKAGQLLARRLYAKSKERADWSLVPTAVFTPLEYACVGMSEEEASDKLGDDLEVYHTYYSPLESLASGGKPNRCYCKVLCDRKDNERVVGVHLCGDHAGEIMQGFAVALRCGARKSDFDATMGIHPTSAEELVTLTVTKRSRIPAERGGC